MGGKFPLAACRLASYIGRPGRKDLVAFIRDPDGYEIELTQRQSDADAKPS